MPTSSCRHVAILLFVSVLVFGAPPPLWAQQSSASSGDKPWWERIAFSGDMRTRYESFYEEGHPDRHRGRFRLRLNLRTTITDEVAFGLRLASGSPEDVASTNQTFDDVFSRKSLAIDQAYLTYKPAFAKGFGVTAGKFGFPVTRTQLVWDDDISWEGLYQQFARSGDVAVRLTAVQAVVDESSGGPDGALFVEEGQVTIRKEGREFQASVASHYFREPDRIALALTSGQVNAHNTNAVRRNAAGTIVGYAAGFHLIDVIGQVTLPTPRANYPVIVMVDWVTNTRAPAGEGTGVWAEARYGRAASPKTYSLSYAYVRAEREAAVSAFAFSDLPGTNFRASLVGFSYAPARRVNAELTAFFSKTLDLPAGAADTTLTRLQMDFRVSF